MYRTHNCGVLRAIDIHKTVKLSGWVQHHRDKGFIIWVDLRDRYGITQIVFDEQRTPKEVFSKAKELGREFVIQIEGKVIERESKNTNMPTGEIEILATNLIVLNEAITPPFTIEDKSDGGEDLRMKYRYLDIRRNTVTQKLIHRHKVAFEVRNYLSQQGFIEVETPFLIKSTPEGARDFIVPSRVNKGQFYALPQSPQTFKQLLMIGGIDKYFQIVKCFRDEDLRADRQPEFTQIDCEMSFVTQQDVMKQFEDMLKHLLLKVKGITKTDDFPVLSYEEAMNIYGSDKPDIRFDMKIINLNNVAKNKGFKIFDNQELIAGICVKKAASYTRKQIDELTNWVKQPQIGANGLIWIKYNEDASLKSSVDKFYTSNDLNAFALLTKAEKGDLILIIAGEKEKTLKQLGTLRLELAERMNLRNPKVFAPLWVVDFPLLEWNKETQKYHAMHHPFTSPKEEYLHLLDTSPERVKANSYDLVLNGNEIGGGSIRIYDKELQEKMFRLLGFSDREAQQQFGFLMNAFQYGAPPHGGIAWGFDRLVAILGGEENIRNYIAFPKNNSGKDIMIDAPSTIENNQLEELNITLKNKNQ